MCWPIVPQLKAFYQNLPALFEAEIASLDWLRYLHSGRHDMKWNLLVYKQAKMAVVLALQTVHKVFAEALARYTNDMDGRDYAKNGHYHMQSPGAPCGNNTACYT